MDPLIVMLFLPLYAGIFTFIGTFGTNQLNGNSISQMLNQPMCFLGSTRSEYGWLHRISLSTAAICVFTTILLKYRHADCKYPRYLLILYTVMPLSLMSLVCTPFDIFPTAHDIFSTTFLVSFPIAQILDAVHWIRSQKHGLRFVDICVTVTVVLCALAVWAFYIAASIQFSPQWGKHRSAFAQWVAVYYIVIGILAQSYYALRLKFPHKHLLCFVAMVLYVSLPALPLRMDNMIKP